MMSKLTVGRDHEKVLLSLTCLCVPKHRYQLDVKRCGSSLELEETSGLAMHTGE